MSIAEDNIEVQIGKMRVKVDLRNIERSKKGGLESKVEKPVPAPRSDAPKTKVPSQASPGMELHLIGMRAEDALDRLDDYLDEAYAAGMPCCAHRAWEGNRYPAPTGEAGVKRIIVGDPLG